MKSSGDSPVSKPVSPGELGLVVSLLAALVAGWAWWTYQQGYLLYYGDAQAHLNNSRSVFDSRTPGYDQLGTVWLPMLHVLCLPFVRNMAFWSSGLAGTFPVACCFVVAGTFLYLAARQTYQSQLSAALVAACFALNPNVLYLSVITMTELVFLAGLAVLVFAGIMFESSGRRRYVALAILASWWMSLTRYDGWFLIPFEAAWIALNCKLNAFRMFFVFATMAALAPVYWMAHSWWETANALDFFNGPYSAKAIQHGDPYPGFQDWPNALRYYGKAAQLCAGWGLVVVAFCGLFFLRARRVVVPTALLLLPCVFYVWSIHSSGNPIHVPQLAPFSYYNTRYGIAFVFFAAFAAGALVEPANRLRPGLAFLIPMVSVAPWFIQPSRENWICWKESEFNSNSRRAWTAEAAVFVRATYRDGQGILAPFGDVSGIFCRAQIPLAQVLHEGDGPAWSATTKRPDLLHQQLWAIAQEGDVLDRALEGPHKGAYSIVKQIKTPNAPTLKIYKRND